MDLLSGLVYCTSFQVAIIAELIPTYSSIALVYVIYILACFIHTPFRGCKAHAGCLTAAPEGAWFCILIGKAAALQDKRGPGLQ